MTSAYAAAALAGECSAMAAAPFGRQELTLNNAALRLGALAAGGELPASAARAALLAAAAAMRAQRGKPAWSDAELAWKVDRGLRDGARSPRRAPDAMDTCGPRGAALPPPPARAEDDGTEARNTFLALRLFNEAQPAAGSPVETYLAARGIAWSDGYADLRFHPAAPRGKGERLPAMVALLRDARTGDGCGAHRTFLAPDGAGKIGHGPAKMMLGRSRGAVVMLVPSAEVTHGLGIAEGIETALSVLARGWAPMWAAGSAGGMEGFPVLPGIECLTLFADQGERGTEAATRCAEPWRAQGREVRVVAPRRVGDFNDAIRGGVA